MNVDINTLRKNPTDEPPPDETAAPFWDVASAGWKKATITGYYNGPEDKIRTDMLVDMWGKLSPESRDLVGRQMNGREFDDPLKASTALILDAASREVPKDPVKWGNAPLDMVQFQDRVDQQRRKDLADAQAILDRPGGGWAEFLGSAGRAFADPLNIAMAPFGVEGGLVRTMAGEAVLNGVAEGLAVPREREVAQELDQPKPNMTMRVAEGAALGAGLVGAVAGVVRFAKYVSARKGIERAMAPAGVHPLENDAEIEAAQNELTGDKPVRQAIADQTRTLKIGAFPSMSDFDFSAAGNASPKTNRIGYVYGKLIGKGVSPEDAAAIVGNGMVESGPSLNPGEIGDGGNALGFLQWNGPRKRALEEFAAKAGKPANDLDTQIDFLMHELDGPEAGAWAKVQAGKTAEEKAALFSQWFERPGIPHTGRRVGHARDVYKQFSEGQIPKWLGPVSEASDEVPLFSTSRGYTGDGQVSTSSGRTIDVKYEVVDASILQRATGDLQPRDRSRTNSDAWIAETAARLDPAQLMPSPNAATGTPIVGADNIIESGNGRFGAIMSAYERFPDRAEAYRREIENMTGQPIPEGVERPVLVARRTSDMDPATRRQFVIDAQDSGVARMTPTEIARTSSRAMTPELLGRMDLGAGILDPKNAGFVRGALDALPASERNALFNPDGGLNRAGQERIRDALFARAWNAPDILARFTETDAGELKSLMDALNEAAPSWAALRADIEAGRVRPDADISPFVLEAIRIIASARELSQRDNLPMANALAELLDEVDMLDGAWSPLTVALVKNKFWKNGKAASAAEIGDFLKRYASEARTVAATDSMFAGTTAEILRAIDPKVFGDLPDDLGTPRTVVTRGQSPTEVPQMQEVAYAKGADSPEAVEADQAAFEDLRGSPEETPMPDLAGVEPREVVPQLAMAQPFEDLDTLYRKAAVAQERLATEGKTIAEELGIEFKDPGLKDRAATEEKLPRKGYTSPRLLTDVSRGGFVLKDFAEGDVLVERLAQSFDLVDEGWKLKPDTSYLDRKVLVRHPDGMLSEVQIWTPEMAKAKAAETAAYTKMRSLDPASLEVKALSQQSAQAYSAAIRGDKIDLTSLTPSATSKAPKVFPKKVENSASVSPAQSAVQRTSRASTFDQDLPASRIATAANPRPGGLNTIAGRYSQERKPISDMGENPSVKDNSNMGAADKYVNSPELQAAKAEFESLTIDLGDGTVIRPADMLDDIEADEQLAHVLAHCNPKGQA